MIITQRTRNRKNVFHFSLVEVLFCLVVLVIGIIGIMGIFPQGLDSANKAIQTSFGADVGEQFLHFNASKARTDWTWLNAIANSKPDKAEPGAGGWDKNSFFSSHNIEIKSSEGLDITQNDNDGFFLLQQFSNGEVSFSAVVRAWKNLEIHNDGSETAILYVEVSHPYEIPYESPDREKTVFSIELFKAPEIEIKKVSYADCKVTRSHGGGFTTTLSKVSENVTDGTFEIELSVANDGCLEPDCQALSDYLVETPFLPMINTFGNPVASCITEAASTVAPNNDPLDGFKVTNISDIGGGVAETFRVTYVLTSLQNQQVAAKTTSGTQIVEFSEADCNYVLNCSAPEGDDNQIYCSDPANLTPPTWPSPDFTWNPGSNPEVGSYFCKYLGTENDPVDQDGTPLADLEVTVCNGPNWLYWNPDYLQIAGTPDEAGTFTWTLCVSDGCYTTETTMTMTIDCPGGNNNPPVWPNPNFTWNPSGSIQVGTYFCKTLGSSNNPADPDGTSLSDLNVSVCDGPTWLYWDPNYRQIAGTPNEAGTFTWTLCVSDGCYEDSTTITFSVDCAGGVTPPSWPNDFFALSIFDVNVNEPISTNLGGNLVTGDSVNIALNGANWLTVDNNGNVSGTPTQPGTYTWTLVGANSCGEAAAQVTLNVIDPCLGNTAPVYNTIPIQLAPAIKGQSYAASIASVDLAVDNEGDSLTYSATGLPTGITFNASSISFSGTPTQVGNHVMGLIATDTCGNYSTVQVNLTVGEVPGS